MAFEKTSAFPAHAGIDQYLAAAGRGHLDAARAAWPIREAGQAFGKEIPNRTSRHQDGRPACAMKPRWNRAARREESGDGSIEDRCAAPAGIRGAVLF